jgi:hypothetical protein
MDNEHSIGLRVPRISLLDDHNIRGYGNFTL